MNLLAIGKDWWLPPNQSLHGRETDALFYWFFWITFSILVVVQILIVVFLIKYRYRPGRRATFVHGNSRLEMVWTAVPAMILAVLALGSKRVWDDYRNSPDLQNPDRTTILVIGQRYAWNTVYPGPDGQFGRYLVFPKPTDKLWPADKDGKHSRFPRGTRGVDGPASLPAKEALDFIGQWIDQDDEHRLGKDFSDPAGDDDVVLTPGAALEVPANRPVELLIESKDVIHDFYLPNFRAQLYAVPGMRGRLVFTAQTGPPVRRTVDVSTLLVDGSGDDVIDIDANTPGAENYRGWRYAVGNGKKGVTIVHDGAILFPAAAAKLNAAGIKQVTLHSPDRFEIVCAQLCGEQHSQMHGVLAVLPQVEFDKKHPAAPHTAPAATK